jgi:hypothetical protein
VSSNHHMRLLGSGGSESRNDNDYYPTPPFVTNALCRKFIVPRRVWEPAAGRGWMAHELNRNGHKVISTELFEYANPLYETEWGVNFLSPDETRDVDAIITNPPYEKKLPQEFTQRALDLGVPFVAMLCRLLWVEADGRFEFFSKTPPTDILMMAGRFSCQEKNFDIDPLGGMVSYAWFVWDKNAPHARSKETHFHWTRCKEELEEWKKQTVTNIESFIA